MFEIHAKFTLVHLLHDEEAKRTKTTHFGDNHVVHGETQNHPIQIFSDLRIQLGTVWNTQPQQDAEVPQFLSQSNTNVSALQIVGGTVTLSLHLFTITHQNHETWVWITTCHSKNVDYRFLVHLLHYRLWGGGEMSVLPVPDAETTDRSHFSDIMTSIMGIDFQFRLFPIQMSTTVHAHKQATKTPNKQNKRAKQNKTYKRFKHFKSAGSRSFSHPCCFCIPPRGATRKL